MSRGLSKLQRAIVGLLDGSIKRSVYANSSCGGSCTNELLAELENLELVRRDIPRKVAMFTVRRACMSLLNQGILKGEYMIADEPFYWAKVACWTLTKTRPGGDGAQDSP